MLPIFILPTLSGHHRHGNPDAFASKHRQLPLPVFFRTHDDWRAEIFRWRRASAHQQQQQRDDHGEPADAAMR